MLPFDRHPRAPALARLVITATILAVAAYAWFTTRQRPLDTAEYFILALLLLAVIPPNLVIIRRKPH